MGTMGTTWGQHGVEAMETTAIGVVGTTWGPCGDYEDDVGTMWGRWGPCGDNKIKNAITFQ